MDKTFHSATNTAASMTTVGPPKRQGRFAERTPVMTLTAWVSPQVSTWTTRNASASVIASVRGHNALVYAMSATTGSLHPSAAHTTAKPPTAKLNARGGLTAATIHVPS
ncbi:hypothetical protein FZEAL_4391 [Fusarium zealandicum]|uniref:Uncharacterized protein n=1 Tax=Fusarium zealandicum TaxID=1053134 RepID=A0A8H4UM05_9HYPO|nr:hypothetical protein FZEAL_4391 [Fusarium zealandicum]